MLSKRIIPCLDIKEGRTVKGINFVDLVDAGDPVEQAAIYAKQGADELVFLDITATVENRKTLIELVKKVASQIDIPFTVGGGISSVEDVSALLNAGADKISINSSAVKDPELIDRLALEFGSQCVVVAIDTRFVDGEHIVHVRGGRTPTEKRTPQWIKEVNERGAGELLLTSMDHDGTKQGFACELLREVNNMVDIPVIASGGAGKMEHFYDVFTHGNADAGLAASIFHFHEIDIPELKKYLIEKGLTIRL
ncbi:imidazole glycerol phosphate synthase subunit HisF [Marinigracilibium pacificum]|uniref:Imidazole glycerol phosphate synthase subunit HisF n=1 Tax=Marinigracilibium pacificum TaxID=2729599 RepID=A0A848J1E7_9BACT|nr:imidazole glycerol phosphate synthase subunit HisF [Marinigracilibium pacificum]NMM50633.1 imidazole glycerol phosphate synthase subunit HisF [Marinigracilibium pacificum]